MPETTSVSISHDAVQVRERILETASDLFYRQGVRAVGVDLVVKEAGVAKTSLYRHFRTKDDLIAAFLEREDQDFWGQWDSVAASTHGNPKDELFAQLEWIASRAGRPGYRGCPQINVAAEFPEADHPARRVASAHKREMRRRLTVIAEALSVRQPQVLGGQLAVLINGAFVSSQMFEPDEVSSLLQRTADVLIAAARSDAA
jgi:AcrR family transcriptional regulator